MLMRMLYLQKEDTVIPSYFATKGYYTVTAIPVLLSAAAGISFCSVYAGCYSYTACHYYIFLDTSTAVPGQ
jgi:hypothetical protein